jgi:GT2 family glycosyltransferase
VTLIEWQKLMHKMKDIAILIPSWKSYDLLKVCIPSLLNATKSNSEIIVVVNENVDKSIDYLKETKITYFNNPCNDGPSAVDHVIPYMKEVGFKYVANVNTDMLFSEGWDVELIKLLEEKKPCAVSCSLVEPIGGDYFFYDNLGDFCIPNNHNIFNDNVRRNKYVTELTVSYNHPILVTIEDFLAVGGYSDNMKKIWIGLKGKGLDDDFAYRLFMLHNKNYKFIKSNKSFVYHGSSLTLNKLPFQSGKEAFFNQNKLTVEEFRKQIKLHEKI